MMNDNTENEKEIAIKLPTREEIAQLKPKIINIILKKYGDLDTYIESLRDNYILADYFFRGTHKGVNSLSWREQKTIMLHFGLLDGKPKTLAEVAQIMGITTDRVRQIETLAFRLSGRCRSRKKLKDFLGD